MKLYVLSIEKSYYTYDPYTGYDNYESHLYQTIYSSLEEAKKHFDAIAERCNATERLESSETILHGVRWSVNYPDEISYCMHISLFEPHENFSGLKEDFIRDCDFESIN